MKCEARTLALIVLDGWWDSDEDDVMAGRSDWVRDAGGGCGCAHDDDDDGGGSEAEAFSKVSNLKNWSDSNGRHIAIYMQTNK